MKKPPSAIAALLSGKCPQCRKGKVYKEPWYKVTKSLNMHENCPHCSVKIEPEPGFFWGAMYFSYALVVAIFFVVGFAFFTIYDDPDLNAMVLTIIGIVAFLAIFIFRLSRLLMMYITAPYRKFKAESYLKK